MTTAPQGTKRGGPRAGAGRPKGVPNKTTASVKDALEQCFNKLGGVEFLKDWAEANPTEFVKAWSKLLPNGMHLEMTHRVSLEELITGSIEEKK